MFEATINHGVVLKKIFEAIKELVTDANFDCSSTGMSLQAMDSSHVSLVNMLLRAEGFDHYRCDRNINLGINMANMSKILKCAGNDEAITLRADDEGDCVTFVFENKETQRVSEWSLKLIDIEGDMLGIPETEYKAVVKLPAAEFTRICKDLSQFGDTVSISVNKDGVKFALAGDTANGSVTLGQNASVDKEDNAVVIELTEPVQLTFALRYLMTFSKAASIANTVTLSLTKDSPLVVEYKFDLGHIRYYLAPKIDDEAEAAGEDE
eukprot:GEZU01039496.1.p1 GENE.GEZU01039496.1~~GEZU01039496.1.p1  ORF type:complete len:266 (+),score=113.53 GEZU01039496.1:107-904(+)